MILVGPSETFSFPAVIDSDAPCKVGFNYAIAQKPNRFLQKLPKWLASRWPLAGTNRVAMTDAIRPPLELVKTAARLRASAEADLRDKEERMACERERRQSQEWRPPLLPLPDSGQP
jgi:hypothetical protein